MSFTFYPPGVRLATLLTFSTRDNASLADFLQILRLRKALIALILALLVVLTTVAVTAFLPRWYLATTKVRVEKPEGEVRLFQAQSTGGFDPYFLQDQFKIMQSEKILYPVIETAGTECETCPAARRDDHAALGRSPTGISSTRCCGSNRSAVRR